MTTASSSGTPILGSANVPGRPARPSVIPYITRRCGEVGDLALMLGVLPRLKGLRYLDEGPGDRDHRGVLWARCSQLLEDGMPVGTPEFGEVHPSRQRDAMMRLRCQVCMESASKTSLGYLFLAARPNGHKMEPGWPEGVLTAQPPLCLEHARVAIEECHHLVAAGHVAIRAKRPRFYGVLGTPYRFGAAGVVPAQVDGQDEEVTLPYGHVRAPWVLASQLVRRLCDVTVVDLNSEAEAAGLMDSRSPICAHACLSTNAGAFGGQPGSGAGVGQGQETRSAGVRS